MGPGMVREGEASWALAIPLKKSKSIRPQKWLFKFRLVDPDRVAWPSEELLSFYHQDAHEVEVGQICLVA